MGGLVGIPVVESQPKTCAKSELPTKVLRFLPDEPSFEDALKDLFVWDVYRLRIADEQAKHQELLKLMGMPQIGKWRCKLMFNEPLFLGLTQCWRIGTGYLQLEDHWHRAHGLERRYG